MLFENRKIIFLALSNSTSNRIEVAQQPNTPAELLCYLSNDEEWNVRESVARNINTSRCVVHKLTKDKSRLVREAAKAVLETGSVKSETIRKT